jgi:hypothetical protein
MGRRISAVAVALALLVPLPGRVLRADDDDLGKGIALVDDGDYDAAILVLDTAARRLAEDPKRTSDLSQAYLYLGIAYMGKGHEAAAKAKFKEAVAQIKDLTLSPDKFPPKVIDVFEAAKSEANAASRTTVAPAKAEKKGGSGKILLIAGGVAAAGGIAAAVGGGGGATATTLPADSRNRLEFSGRLPNAGGGSYDVYTVVATRPGPLEARLTWTNGQIGMGIGCWNQVDGVDCGGNYNRTSNTTAVYTSQAAQATYLIQPYNNSNASDTYTLVVLFP